MFSAHENSDENNGSFLTYPNFLCQVYLKSIFQLVSGSHTGNQRVRKNAWN